MHESLKVVQAVYDAFGVGDVPTVLSLLDERVEWWEAENAPYARPGGGPWVGHQEVVDHVFARIAQDNESFRVEVRRLVDAGDTVLAENRYRGTAKGRSEPFDVQVAHVWDVRDGLVVRWQQYLDTWSYRQLVP
jgi:ketosteroid isomerase-like protein